eukprot:CAMPEP_0113665622 /NCGR_PEP_ID=MMETSP0038_2-20120614/2407_1 /TAXON_ID=2898 /ORGANISM="Cryptomonas paramecium" /LENGTH=150 /DNA_ID=CAMNT_0000580995 /DNA_START=15 /DNA_END=464 /DNA_ORIENTATION=+ /assembly_acc=CAM_ASM_000170
MSCTLAPESDESRKRFARALDTDVPLLPKDVDCTAPACVPSQQTKLWDGVTESSTGVEEKDSLPGEEVANPKDSSSGAQCSAPTCLPSHKKASENRLCSAQTSSATAKVESDAAAASSADIGASTAAADAAADTAKPAGIWSRIPALPSL